MSYVPYLAEIYGTQQLYYNRSRNLSAYINIQDLLNTNLWRGYWRNNNALDYFWFQLKYYSGTTDLTSLLETTFITGYNSSLAFFDYDLLPRFNLHRLILSILKNEMYNIYLAAIHAPHIYMMPPDSVTTVQPDGPQSLTFRHIIRYNNKYLEFEKYDLTDYVHSNIRFIVRVVTKKQDVENILNKFKTNSIGTYNELDVDDLNSFLGGSITSDFDTDYPDIILDGTVFDLNDTFATDMMTKFIGDSDYSSFTPSKHVRIFLSKNVIKNIFESSLSVRDYHKKVILRYNIDSANLIMFDYSFYFEYYYNQYSDVSNQAGSVLGVLYLDLFPSLHECSDNMVVEILNKNIQWNTSRVSFDILNALIMHTYDYRLNIDGHSG